MLRSNGKPRPWIPNIQSNLSSEAQGQAGGHNVECLVFGSVSSKLLPENGGNPLNVIELFFRTIQT